MPVHIAADMAEQIVTQTGVADTGGLTGWAALDDTMKKRDEQTAKDHMSDIDTLLVFAGLYSAVLTAFLIESYKNLQEDPQQVVIGILRQISSQTNNYTVTSSHVNSSTPFSDPSTASFVPRATDIRVNVCWFASLVFSLSTASFGILVKQWLREYLAIDHAMAPHERARIRYFRTIGLNDWKLFEIAAILPLILQLALALFFVGLCFFTWSVHRSIGTTSVCLVTGWAAFFILALLAPIFSPKCPYKTTFLKAALSGTRIYALSAKAYIGSRLMWFIGKARHAAKLVASKISSRSHDRIQESQTRADDDDENSNDNHDKSGSCVALLSFLDIKKNVSAGEESSISHSNVQDTTILLDVDIMQNDDLLVGMQAALQQTPLPLKTVFQFALDVMGRRLNRDDLHEYVFSWENTLTLAALSNIARNAVMNIVTDGILTVWDKSTQFRMINTLSHDELRSTEPACQFLVSDGGSVTPKVWSLVQKMLHSVLSGRFMSIYYKSHQDGGHERGLSSVISSTRDVFLALEAKYAHHLLEVFFQCYFWQNSSDDADDRIPRSILAERLHWGDILSDDVSFRSLIALVDLALKAIRVADDQRRATRQNLTLSSGEVELLETVLDVVPVIVEKRPNYNFSRSTLSGAISLWVVFRGLFHTPEILPQFLDSILARSDTLATGAGGIQLLELLYYLDFPPWEDYIHAQRDRNPELSLVSALHLCRMVCYCRYWYEFDTLRWHKTCEHLLFLIDKTSASSLPESTQSHEDKHSDCTKASEVAHTILQDIDDPKRDSKKYYRDRQEGASQSNPDHAKREDEQYSRWREKFDVSESQYSDDLIRRLLKFTGPDNVFDEAGFMFWRVRRVMEMQDSEAEVEVAKHDTGIEAHGGTQLSEEEPETERAEFKAHSSHGQSSTVPGTLAMVNEFMDTGSRNSSNKEHGELWHGPADVPIYRNSVLTHN